MSHQQPAEGELLAEEFGHDFSTAEHGVVPLDRRRPMRHFTGLLVTLEAGFAFLFIGTQLHDSGYSLVSTFLMCLVACGMYFAYVIPAAYLGSRTGQTHSLLTRSVFGVVGSWLVSGFIFVTILGWVGYQAGLMVQVWNGLYGWPIFTLTLTLPILMITNNLFGFIGISAFARYAVTPFMIAWVIWLVCKALTTDSSRLSGTHAALPGSLGFWALVGVMLGFAVWGNEPDLWRYGKPRLWWPTVPYVVALLGGFTLFVCGGWMMARLAGSSDFGTIVQFTTSYSLFGAAFLTFIFVTVTQIAIVDACYYEAINPMQNLFGDSRYWKRWYSCAIAAGCGVLAAWLVNYKVTNGFFQVANLLAITVPCATVIMIVDHFLVPRWLHVSRAKLEVAHWRDTALINLPAVVSLILAVLYGAWSTGVLPYVTSSYRAPGPVAAWVLAGVFYLVGVALTQRIAPRSVEQLLGFSAPARRYGSSGRAVVDLASTEPTVIASRSNERAAAAEA